MPPDLFSPPPAVPDELDLLRSALDNRIPAKSGGHNLLIATWNICAFGDLTRNWTDEADNSPKRNFRWLYFIHRDRPPFRCSRRAGGEKQPARYPLHDEAAGAALGLPAH